MSTEFYNRNFRMPNSFNGSEDNNSKFSNYSMSFDGSEYVSITDGVLLNSSGYTLSMWFNATSFSSVQCLVFDTSSNIKFISIDSATSIRVRDGVNERSFTVPTMSVSNWYNIIVTVDNGSCKVYLNSTESTTGAQTVNQNWTINGINGYSNVHGGSFNFTGKLDHCGIFDYALTQAQVTALYGSSSTGVGNPMAITNGRKPIFYAPLGDYSAYNGTEYLVTNSAVSDYVFDFNGSNNYIDCGNDSSLNLTSEITLSVWVKTTDQDSINNIIKKDDGGSNRSWNLSWRGSSGGGSRLVFWNWSTDGTYNYLYTTGTPASNFADGNWHHVVATYDGTANANGAKIYLDGVLISQGAVSRAGTGLDITTTNVNIGNDLTAYISNAAIFNTALPATGTESIESLYNYGTPPEISSYSGLQGWWKLDASATFDGSNWSIPDSSSNSNTGTSSGMTAANLVQASPPLLVNEPYSRYALNFDGSNDYIDVSNNGLGLTTAISISAWVKIPSGAGNSFDFYTIIAEDNLGGTNRNWFFGWRYGYKDFYFQVYHSNNTNTQLYSNVGDVNDGNWHHVVGVYDGTISTNGFKLYIDNVVGEKTATSTGVANNNIPTYIGATNINNIQRFFEGEISNISVWNAALTSAQVTEIYNNGLPSNLNNHSSYSNLVSWWQLGENSSFNTNWTVIDEKGTNNGTSVNMAEDDLVNGVGTSGNGISSGMSGGDNIVGEAPFSDSNALSINMPVTAKSTSVPS